MAGWLHETLEKVEGDRASEGEEMNKVQCYCGIKHW